jgi:transposase InsO family protein
MEGETGYGRKQPVPTLTRENHAMWFRQMKRFLSSKDIKWVIDGSTPALTPQSETSSSTVGPPALDSSQYSLRYQKDNNAALYWIGLCISEEDDEFVSEHNEAKDVWEVLERKYQKRLQVTARQYQAQYNLYQMDEDTTIDQAWAHLKHLARKITDVDPDMKALFTPKRRAQQLLSILPDKYSSIRDAIDTQGKTDYEEILLLLQEREESMDNKEMAMLAQRRGFKDSGRPTSQRDPTCNLCDGDHWMRDCPGLQAAKQAARAKNPNRVTKRRSPPPKHTRRPSPDKDELKSMVKKLTLEVQSLKKRQERRSHKAYQAQKADSHSSAEEADTAQSPLEGEEVDEVAHATVDAKGKYPSSEWLLDFCASSHMTDQPSLFRDMKPLQARTWIKVGGGYIRATHVGEAVMGGKSGQQVVLKDVLYVPGLGINLVSWNQISQQFGVQPPSFTLLSTSGKPVIQTRLQGGVPFIHSISHLLKEKKQGQQAYLAEEVSFLAQEPLDGYAFASNEQNLKQWELWHRRYAHLGKGLLRNLHKAADLKKPIPVPNEEHKCRVCSLTKMRKFMGKVTERKPERLALVSIDICGPFGDAVSRSGNRYWLEIVDNFSRMHWTIPLKSREQAPLALSYWKIKVERQSSALLKAVRSDGARELTALLRQWERDHGISAESTEAYNSLQNGVVERSIQTSEECVRAMLEEAKMPVEFWEEALQAQTYLRNTLPNGPEIDGFKVSPAEAFTGIKPSVNHLRVWGCKAIVYMDQRSQPTWARRDKLVNRGKEAVFVGYVENTTKAWLFWEPDMRTVKQHSHVYFFEEEKGGELDLNILLQNQSSNAQARRPVGRPRKLPQEQLNPDPAPVFVHIPPPPKDVGEYVRVEDEDLPEEGKTDHLGNEDCQDQNKKSQEIPERETRSQARKRMATDDAEAPESKHHKTFEESQAQKRPRELEDEGESPEAKHHKAFISMMYQLDPSMGWVEEFLDEVEETAFAAVGPTIAVRQEVPIPKSYKEAVEDEKWGHMWKEAIQRELIALESNNTWTPAVPPNGANLVTSKWVFDVKRMISGAIEKFKARLVARGFSQKFGVDFMETFAPTVRHDTLRVFMAVVCKDDLELHQVDVNNAFTESTLQEDIFMIPPPGVNIPPNMVFKILRSLYGLKQAARDWNQLCVSKLIKIGFTQSEVDPCLLIHHERKIMIMTHVDDIPIAAPKLEDVLWFKKELGKVFKIKDLGEPDKILGVRITRDRKNGTLKLDQGHYIKENLARISMTKETAHPTFSPMDSYESLRPSQPHEEREDKQEYQSLNGTWMWPMTMTRPDIAFPLGRLSSYVADPSKQHMRALKKLSRYLRSFPDLGLKFSRQGEGLLQGYSDADFASDPSDRVSILGYIFFLCGAPVSWMSKKQKSVATSTMEAEYMAMGACAKQSQFLSAILREMGYPQLVGECSFQPTLKVSQDAVAQLRPVQLYGDNQAALTLVKDAHVHERSKHIDVAYNFVRKLWWQRRIAVEYVPTKEMVADGLTKPKNGPQFQEFVKQLRLK